MPTHVMSFTLEEKIKAVRAGDCTQTIRRKGKREITPGDEILFHGWTGAPYRSKWSWRKRVVVTCVDQVWAQQDCLIFWGCLRHNWDSLIAQDLAAEDWIDPPTGPALRDVLMKLNGKLEGEYRIIRWGPEDA